MFFNVKIGQVEELNSPKHEEQTSIMWSVMSKAGEEVKFGAFVSQDSEEAEVVLKDMLKRAEKFLQNECNGDIEKFIDTYDKQG